MVKRRGQARLSATVVGFLAAVNCMASDVFAKDGSASIRRGPDDVSIRIEENKRPKETTFDFPGIDRALDPWNNWKAGLSDKGFRLGFDYNLMGISSDNSIGEDDGLGHIFRTLVSWDLWQRGNASRTGTLDIQIENRHRIETELPPEALAGSFGWAGTAAPDWSDQEWGLPVFMLRQRLDIGETPIELRIGRMSAFSQFSITAFSDNLTQFTNNSIILNPTIAYPSAGSFGVAGYIGFPRSNFYALAMIMDANGSYDDLSFSSLDEGEFFKGLEFGWSEAGVSEGPSYLLNNVHVALWQSDERGWGVGLTGSYIFDETGIGVFGRLGYADDDPATLYDRYAAAGITKSVFKASEVGIGISWGEVTGTDEEQVAVEAFYRWQLAQNLAIIPSVQFLSNPVFNEEDDSVTVFGLRTRVTF